MAKFERFSDLSLLYADHYHLVEAMGQQLDGELGRLWITIEDAITERSWYAPDRHRAARGKYYVHLLLHPGDRAQAMARIQIYLNAALLGTRLDEGEKPQKTRQFSADLAVVDTGVDLERVKSAFDQLARNDLIKNFGADEYAPLSQSRNRYLVQSQRICFELDSILEQMLAAIERLQPFFSMIEQAFETCQSKAG